MWLRAPFGQGVISLDGSLDPDDKIQISHLKNNKIKYQLVPRVSGQNTIEVGHNYNGKRLRPNQVGASGVKAVWWKSAKRKRKKHTVPPLVIFHVCIRSGNKFSIPRKKMHRYYDPLATESAEYYDFLLANSAHWSVLPFRFRGISMFRDMPAAEDVVTRLETDIELHWFSSSSTSSVRDET